jgi:hypothetical protein
MKKIILKSMNRKQLSLSMAEFYFKELSAALQIRVGIKKPTQKNPPKKTQKKPPKKTH